MRACDRRHVRRLKKIVDRSEASASLSLPRKMKGDEAEIEGMYRFFGNLRIEPEVVLDAHQEWTASRAQECGTVLVAHDCTSFTFKGEARREGLGPICSAQQGLYAHYSLALSLSGQPLGVIALRAWRRSDEPRVKAKPGQWLYDEDRESLRWHDAVHEVAERLAGRAQAIHVMDREGDSYELFADLIEHEQRFVIRVCHDRLLGQLDPSKRVRDRPRLYEVMATAETVLERQATISRRGKPRNAQAGRVHPARAGRVARLSVRVSALEVPRNDAPVHLPDCLKLNFVEAIELEPPDGQAPVHWRLVTTESVETAEDVAAVIDYYRMRWKIEEYFKAIKTGCQFEKIQLERGRNLVMALAIYSAVAWRMLLMRWMEREQPDAPASAVFTPVQLELLADNQRKIRRPWTAAPTSRDGLYATAALGGHIRNNGPPGWLVLSRGMDALLLMEAGVHYARSPPGSEKDPINL